MIESNIENLGGKISRILIFSLFGFFLAFTCVSGAVDGNAPSGVAEYSYYQSTPSNWERDRGTGAWQPDPPFNYFTFNDIETYDRIYHIRYEMPGKMIHTNDGVPVGSPNILSWNSEFTIVCSGYTVASGTSVTWFDDSVIWLYFDGDIEHHGLTGDQQCTITGLDNDDVVNSGYANSVSNAYYVKDQFMIASALYAGSSYYFDTKITALYGSYWENTLSWETRELGGMTFTDIEVKRLVGTTVYPSDWYFSAPEGDINNTADTDYGTCFYTRPIYTSCKDALDKWHNLTLFADAVPTDYIFGYVRDAESGYLLSDAIVNLSYSGYTDFTTGADGKYVFTDLDFVNGDGILNCSKDGYENSSVAVTLASGGRYDISLVQNVTVYDGTATIYGFVRDYDDYSLINNALVSVTGNGSGFSIMSNMQGYFVFYNVTGTGVHSLVGKKSGYESGSVSVNVTTLDAKYSATILLLNESSVTIPDSEDDEDGGYNPFLVLIEALGLGDYFGWIMAIIIICVLAGVMSYLTNGSSLATGIGALFGFLISCFAGFLPMWLIAVAILGSCAFFAMMVMKGK